MGDKVQSRKFVVWLVWVIITVLLVIAIGIAFVVTKDKPDSLIELFGKTLDHLFTISAIYLGVNVIQKGAFAIADVLAAKKEENTEYVENTDLR